MYPHSARIWNNLGNALATDAAQRGTPQNSTLSKAGHEEAVQCFEHAIESDPDYPDALFNLGVEYSILKLNEKSEQNYRRLFEVNANYPTAHYNLAEVMKSDGRYAEAIEQYELELKRDPNKTDAKEGLQAARQLAGEE